MTDVEVHCSFFFSPNGTTVLSHLPLQQSNSSNNNKKNGLTVEETTKTEVVRGARHGRAPQTNTHVNGDPLSVFDDSTLSDVSDNEGMNEGQGRYICSMLLICMALSLPQIHLD